MKLKALLPAILFFTSLHVFAQSDSIGSGIALNFPDFLFDTGSYVDLGDKYNNLQLPFTFECWMKLDSYPSGNSQYSPFATDNLAGARDGNYYGFWIQINHKGILSAEIGEGTGAGEVFRGGKQTIRAVPLAKWFHLAIVFVNPGNVTFYINGDSVAAAKTDGGYNDPIMRHSSGHAVIGHWENFFTTNTFVGEIDEIRLWDVVRSNSSIRNNMCKKIKIVPDYLIGYWKADESLTSNTVQDYSATKDTGTLKLFLNVGVTKVISGAPIGDISKSIYSSNWDGQSLSLTVNHDKVTVKDIRKSPFGVQLYAVNSAPFNSGGLSNPAPYYFGVFTADSTRNTIYRVVYVYSPLDGMINSGNKINAELFSKSDDSATAWNVFSEIKDTSNNQVRDTLIKARMEYILNVPQGFSSPEKLIANSAPFNLTVSPNPFCNELRVFGNWDEIKISNNLGKIIFDTKTLKNNLTTINTSSWSAGMYFLITKLKDKVSADKIILSR